MKREMDIIRLISEVTRIPREEIPSDTQILNSNIITSLSILELMAKLEKEFEIEILPEELIADNFMDVDCISRFVQMKTGS